jgi:hypothetical protein
MRRFLLTILILVALAAAAFVSAPWFALRGLQSAARDGDVQALAELIDYPAVRAGLRAQVTPAAAAAPLSLWQDPLGAMRRAIEPLQPQPPALERHLTPQGLHALAGAPEIFPAVRHWGPNRVRYAAGPKEARALLTFQRQGWLRWKLVQIGLPSGASPPARP